jgi:hypothetical protein
MLRCGGKGHFELNGGGIELSEEARIKRLRRTARARGLILRRSRIDGTWMIVDPNLNAMLAGPTSASGAGGLDLDEAEEWLAQPAK